MLRRWYVPNWSGDFRLEAEGEDKCRLTAIDPTPAEIEQLGTFLKKARKKGWIDDAIGISLEGETKLVLPVTIQVAGKLLLERKLPRDGILTAVKSTKGTLDIVLGDDQEQLDAATSKEDAAEAVTTRRPTLCCPEPIPGPDVRASEVLQSFCTPSQWRSWMEKGYLICTGQKSGHHYRVAHRHSPLARAQGKVVWDVTDDGVVHAYDWSVPPAEEALAMKLTIEHAEHWIRNESSILRNAEMKLYNPFVSRIRQGLDGTEDAGFVSGFAGALQTIMSYMKA